MDHFLKRVPAFSRALGDSDSDDETISDNSQLDLLVDNIRKTLNLDLLLDSKPFSHLVISIGPFATAFVHIGLQLSNEVNLGTVAIGSKNTATFHYISNDLDSKLIISIKGDTTVSSYEQKRIIKNILNNILHIEQLEALINVSIICTVPDHQFLSKCTKPLSPFLRILATHRPTECSLPFVVLEHPNILHGLSAELLTMFSHLSISTTMYMLYYSQQASQICAWPAVKEIFNYLNEIQSTIFPCESFCTTWDELTDIDLKESCTNLICGNKPSKMDQMYT